MASECCLSLTKYFLFLFNLIFFLLGSVLLSLGLWILLSENSISMHFPPYISFSLFSYLMIISGSVTMSLSFFGCVGSLQTVKYLLATYFILLTVLLAAQIVGGVLFYTQRTEWARSLEENTRERIKSFGRNSSLNSFERIFGMTINYIQQEAKCCGWEGKDDWKDIPCSCSVKGNATVNATNEINDQIDFTCFSNGTFLNNTRGIYTQGCSENVKEWLDENLHIILVVILAICVVECLQWICLVSYCCLNRTHRCCPRESLASHVQLSRSQFVTSVVCLSASFLHAEILSVLHRPYRLEYTTHILNLNRV